MARVRETVPEGSAARAEPPLRHRELEPQTEARRPLQDQILTVHLLRDRHLHRRGGQDVVNQARGGWQHKHVRRLIELVYEAL